MNRQQGYLSNIPKLKAIRTLFWMHFFAAVLVPFYTDWGGIRLSHVLYLNAWFMLWNFLLEVPTGTVADFLGRKVSLALGGLLAAGAALLYVSRPGLGTFMAAEVVLAAAYTLHSGADEALAYDSMLAEGRTDAATRTLAGMESFKLGGIILATLAGGFIAARLGLAAPMALYAAPAAVSGLLALTLCEPPARKTMPRRPSYRSILKDGSRYFLGHRTLLLLATEAALTNALAWGIIFLFQPLLARSGVELAWFGLVHAAGCLGQIMLLSRVEALTEMLGSRRRLLAWMAYGGGISFMLLGLVRDAWVVIPLIVLAMTTGLPRIPLFSAHMNRHIPSDKRATVLSAASMSRTVAIVALNPLIGLLADWSLTWAMLALGLGLVALTAASRIEERHLTD